MALLLSRLPGLVELDLGLDFLNHSLVHWHSDEAHVDKPTKIFWVVSEP